MGTAKESEKTYREQLQQALHHNKILNSALEQSDQAWQKAMKDIERLQGDAARMEAQLEASQKNNELLAKRINEAGRDLQDRVMQLIGFCRKHGIDYETGEKKE